ncbi:MAG: septum formation protein Maf [Woeseia sp.]|nr:septum formation protein Maf [Woeseia sp.]MBT8097087.1 septum formation protein Maf [Woeseia sp.]NNE62057.1 septum formation protein Maf [Woeseia sp.]NNL53668.1 septum formation protein Maf [Woeseia sp.]
MRNPHAVPLVLASSSAYRRSLLERFINDFDVISPDVDEAALDAESPLELAELLARTKAETVLPQHRKSVIIGSDQVAVRDDKVIGKPGDHAHAIEQLLSASGKTVEFLTAVCVLDPANRRRYEHVDHTQVRFRQFDRRLADVYLHHDKPYDCAGSFKLEGAGFVLFEEVRTTDPTALVGLPMIWLAGTLRELGQLLP